MTLAFAAPAAAQGAVATPSAPLFFGAGVSFLISEDELGEGLTAKGFDVNVSKDIFTSGNLGIGPVGDFVFHTTEGINLMSFLGGIRVTANMPDAKVIPFGQFLLGGTRASDDFDNSSTGFTFMIGGGVHVPLNDKWNFMAGIDIISVKFEGAERASDPRIMFGVSTKIGG